MRVLHVEDNPVDADLARRQLARTAMDISLDQAASLASARTCLEHPENYDVALVDLRLPDGSGLELLAEIRARQLPLAVVMLTGSGDQESAIVALQAGADDYLSKGHNAFDKLPATLRDAWQRFHEAASRRSHPLRVLYAEHNQADIDLTQRHLARHAPHIRVTVVNSVGQVLSLLPTAPSEPSAYDVLLLDYRLPGTDALEAVKILRAERGLDIPIVLVSGHGSEEVAAQAIHLGVDDYLSKHDGYLYELPATLEKVHRQAELARERSNLRATTERLNHVLAASPVILYSLRLTENGMVPNWVSGNIGHLLGFTESEALAPGWWLDHIHPDDRETVLALTASLPDTGQCTYDYRFIDRSGQVRWIHDDLRLIRQNAKAAREAIGAWRDITEAKQAEQIQETRIAVLDGLVGNRSLDLILNQIATRLEELYPEMQVSILLRNTQNGRLYTGAAPSLPAFYNAAVNGLEPRVGFGSCGSAAGLGETVIVADIHSHPYWAPYAHLAEQAGLAACWSIPFKDNAGQVLGTFGVYYGQPRTPSQNELNVIGEFARITGLAVERGRAYTHLCQSAAVFESTSEGVIITDLNSRIVQVNRAYTEITGYSEAEVLGRNPNMVRSGHQDASFYQAMWNSLLQTGHWRGEIWNRRKNGEVFPQLLTISTVYDNAGQPSHYVGVMTDISQIKQSEERLEHLAHYDPLTELPNRLLVQSRLEHALELAGRSHHIVAVLFIDLDRFKNINDSLGHPVGDAVLQTIAKRMASRLREGDTLGRLGGDEFLVVLETIRHPEDAAEVASTLIQLLEDPLILPNGHEVYISASIGISLYPGDAQTVTELIQHADAAMYQAKDQGRGIYRYYTSALTSEVNSRLELDSRMRRALVQGEFIVHYQPQIDIATGALIGCEALVRWQDPERGLISPAKFIPLAEETGLIMPLGEWVLRTACAQAKAWTDVGLPPLIMSVNLSGRQLLQSQIVQKVADILNETGLPASQLKLELTESTIMGRGEEAVILLGELRALGLRLAIDDFGTGYSSLAYLKRFPIDELKIDQSFVRDIPHDSNDMEIAATIIAMARNLKLDVLAEGVETQEQLAFLTQQGCHAYQGYLYSRPVPAEEFSRLVETARAASGTGTATDKVP
ncbi:MAG: EAL domain-containing protein [Hydrogenophilaceae bacterium]